MFQKQKKTDFKKLTNVTVLAPETDSSRDLGASGPKFAPKICLDGEFLVQTRIFRLPVLGPHKKNNSIGELRDADHGRAPE